MSDEERRAARGSRRYTRCAMVLPDDAQLVGARVLDLACRHGLGAFKIADRVGPTGFVIGVDPSPEHIARARELAREQHWAGAGWEAHLALVCSALDDFAGAGIADGSVDIAIVNSVLNIAPRRSAVLRAIARALAPGGYLFHDAVLAEQSVPANVRERLAAAGNVFAAAPTLDELEDELAAAGFARWDIVERAPLAPARDDTDEALSGLAFASAVIRARIAGTTARCGTDPARQRPAPA